MKRNRTNMPRSTDTGEEWKPYPPVPYYEVSSDGQVRVALTANRKGSRPGHLHRAHWRFTRFIVCLTDGARRWEEPLADMVAAAHLPAPPFEGAQVYFKDGNAENCAADNLEWMLPDEPLPPSLLTEGETARPVELEGLDGYYVTNKGRVWSQKRRAFLTPAKSEGNIIDITLTRNGKTTHLSLPKLVATAFPEFIGPRPSRNAPLGYRDGDYANCAADNLYWTTHDHIHTARHVRRKAEEALTPEEADETSRAPCPDVIRFMLTHYGLLPAREAIKNQHYYYVDGRFRILCATCATRIARSQESHLDRIDAKFPMDCRVLWPGRCVTCADCSNSIQHSE